jgi:hypothetical protein
MTSMPALLALAVLAAVASCGGKKQPDPPPAADCTAAVDNALAMSKAELKAAIPTIDDQGMAKVKEASITRCKEDNWSPDSRTCMATAKTSAEVAQCEARKTKEQRDALVQAITTAAAPPPDAGSGSGEPGPGSGSGSAGSGSAGAKPAAGSGSGSAAKPATGAGSGSGSGSAAK